jgi:hypothetical protein
VKASGCAGCEAAWNARPEQPQALAETLGSTVEEVHGALAGTVAELAESQGMTLEDVVDALIAPMIERFQQAVENGHITQEQADERIAQMEEGLLQGLESGSWFSMGNNGFRGHIGGAQPQALAEALGVTAWTGWTSAGSCGASRMCRSSCSPRASRRPTNSSG